MTQNDNEQDKELNNSLDEDATNDYYKKNEQEIFQEQSAGQKESTTDSTHKTYKKIFEEKIPKDDELLRQLDDICARSGVSYSQAMEALDATGDVVDALIWLEEKETTGRLASRVVDGVSQLKEKLDKKLDNRKSYRVQVIKNDKVVKEISAPLAVGMAGLLFFPGMGLAGALGSIAAMMNDVNLKLVKK